LACRAPVRPSGLHSEISVPKPRVSPGTAGAEIVPKLAPRLYRLGPTLGSGSGHTFGHSFRRTERERTSTNATNITGFFNGRQLRALVRDVGGRRFKSCHSDQLSSIYDALRGQIWGNETPGRRGLAIRGRRYPAALVDRGEPEKLRHRRHRAGADLTSISRMGAGRGGHHEALSPETRPRRIAVNIARLGGGTVVADEDAKARPWQKAARGQFSPRMAWLAENCLTPHDSGRRADRACRCSTRCLGP